MIKGQQVLRIESTKTIGESVRTNEILAVVYACANQEDSSTFGDADPCQVNQSISQNNNKGKDHNSRNSDKPDISLNKGNIKRYRHKILSAIEITQDRTYDKDPVIGIELLRSLAIKSAAMHDSDVVKSTVMGLFKILSCAVSNEEIWSTLFIFIPAGEEIKKVRLLKKAQSTTNGQQLLLLILRKYH